MILGGGNVDILLVLITICEIYVFFTAAFYYNFFDMSRRNNEFPGFGRVDLAYENRYN